MPSHAFKCKHIKCLEPPMNEILSELEYSIPTPIASNFPWRRGPPRAPTIIFLSKYNGSAFANTL
eukprot:3375826-Heterocapsa_arctica.AAC.1